MSSGSNDVVAIRRLGDIAEVLPGYSTGGALVHDPTGTHQVVQSRHLQPGTPYAFRPEDDFRINPAAASTRDISRYELEEGDILFMSRGTRNFATVIGSVSSPAIAPVSFFVVRVNRRADGEDELVESAYVAWYLNTPSAQNEVANIRTGAGTPIVQRSAFRELAIPLPGLATQRRIGELAALMGRERQLQEQLASAVGRSHDVISSALANDLFARSERISGEGE